MRNSPRYFALLLFVCLGHRGNLSAETVCTNITDTYRLVPGRIVSSPLYFVNNSMFKWLWWYTGGFGRFNFDDVDASWVPFAPNNRLNEGVVVSSSATNTMPLCFRDGPVGFTLLVPISPGLNLLCSQTNLPATYEDIVGLSPVGGARLYKLKTGATNFYPLIPAYYDIFIYENGKWSPSNPIAAATEAVIVILPPILHNPRVVAGDFHFDAETGVGAPVSVEWSDTLAPGSWQLLGTFYSQSRSTEIVDPDVFSHLSRYYRVRIF